MSPITKLFVVLHVVLSMLLTAGVVVFVNRVDEYNKIVADWKTKATTADARATAATTAADAAKEALNAANKDLATQVEQARNDKTAAAAALDDLNVKLADATKQLAILTAANDNAIAVVKASQAAQSQYMTQVAELRTKVDELTKAKFELDTAVANLTNERDVLEKQRRDLAEKVSSIDADLSPCHQGFSRQPHRHPDDQDRSRPRRWGSPDQGRCERSPHDRAGSVRHDLRRLGRRGHQGHGIQGRRPR